MCFLLDGYVSTVLEKCSGSGDLPSTEQWLSGGERLPEALPLLDRLILVKAMGVGVMLLLQSFAQTSSRAYNSASLDAKPSICWKATDIGLSPFGSLRWPVPSLGPCWLPGLKQLPHLTPNLPRGRGLSFLGILFSVALVREDTIPRVLLSSESSNTMAIVTISGNQPNF